MCAITTGDARIHYYFAAKGDLGAALTNRYTAHYALYLDGLLAQRLDPVTCLQRYCDMFAQTLRNDNRMCLAGILSAEHNELPEEVRTEVVKFGDMNVDWLARVLGMIGTAGPAALRTRAMAICAAVSGAQLIAHSRGDVGVFNDMIASYRASGLIP